MQAHNNQEQYLSVLQAHKGIIYKVANAYCSNEENRKDLVQEIMIQLWLSFDKYNSEYQWSTWIYRIALNVAISFYRKESRGKHTRLPLPDLILYLPEDARPDTIETELALLQRFIQELREIDRAIILLYLEKKPQQEIAGILGLSETNISTRVSRIKQQLKQKFATHQQ